MPSASTRIAAAQYPIERLADWAAYEAKARRWTAEAVQRGAQVLLLPEYAGMEVSGWAPGGGDAALFEASQGMLPRWEALWGGLATTHRVLIAPGSVPVRQANGRYRNRGYLF